jgi:uncharacterized repeat protein (TIGR03803 family)
MVKKMQYLPSLFQTISRGMHALLAFTLALALAAAASTAAQAQTYTVLHTFKAEAQGVQPWSGVILDKAGNLYGTTNIGGNLAKCPTYPGCGVVYELNPAGKETLLHKFKATPDGQEPTFGNLLMDAAGDLYGTTALGGTGQAGDISDNGVVFALKKTKSGGLKESVLHSFPDGSGDGAGPEGSLIEDAAGNLYGTTFAGGTSSYSAGTVFKITKTGQESVLHSFTGYDGFGPVAGLVQDAAGNMYGTASSGGSAGWGTVFEISAAGDFSVLYNFQGYTTGDGGLASSGQPMVLDSAGNLYGVTWEGGDAYACPGFGCGVVFKLDPAGDETILHTFVGTDGAAPNGVILDAAGNLYGTTWAGGSKGYGTIFELDSAGNFTTLYNFKGGADGASPFGGLTPDNAGNFYGTAYLGGGIKWGCDCGVVFKLTP